MKGCFVGCFMVPFFMVWFVVIAWGLLAQPITPFLIIVCFVVALACELVRPKD